MVNYMCLFYFFLLVVKDLGYVEYLNVKLVFLENVI